ncbi:MAG: hypothetical protein ACOZAK_00325 [Patescibacteria group bacterium]
MERFTPPGARKWESWVPEDTNEETQNPGTPPEDLDLPEEE